MIAVIFEVLPAKGKRNTYLDMAAKLRPELDKIKGFISIERFQSITILKKYFHFHSGKMNECIPNGGISKCTGRHKLQAGHLCFRIIVYGWLMY
jgi:hypothetical protein